jgi:hypothetical protein
VGDEYAGLGEKMWAGMYDEMSGTFRPGMYDFREICLVIRILGTRNFTSFRRNIVPPPQKHGLHSNIPPEVLSKAEEENAREFSALRWVKNMARK